MPPIESGKPHGREGGRATRQASGSRRQMNNTIMFFDWYEIHLCKCCIFNSSFSLCGTFVYSFTLLFRDDTILASTVLCTNGVTLSSPTVPEEIVQQFESLQDQIIKIFDVAFTYTKNIFVITNAEVSS